MKTITQAKRELFNTLEAEHTWVLGAGIRGVSPNEYIIILVLKDTPDEDLNVIPDEYEGYEVAYEKTSEIDSLNNL